jgi:hypothetical protein
MTRSKIPGAKRTDISLPFFEGDAAMKKPITILFLVNYCENE